jgi:class 3 adenylate cyclase
MGALTFATRTECEYAAMLIRRGQDGDSGRAVALLGSALGNAAAIGMAGVQRKARALLKRIEEPGSYGRLMARASDSSGKAGSKPRQVLATILFTDIVGSTERAAELGDQRFGQLLDKYYSLARRQFEAFDGREMSTLGDGVLAIFERPAHAIRCAWAIREAVRELRIEIRAGLHVGECELAENEIRGIAVHIGARVAVTAGPGDVLVSSTVKDLVAGSGISFTDQGIVHLKGVPGQWRLYRAEPQA